MSPKNLESYIAEVLELPGEDISLLVGCVISRKLKKGEVLLREGEVCRSFYLVEKGCLRTYYNKDGVSINLNFTFEGSFTSNLKSYRSRKPSEHIIEAAEKTSVWIFNANTLSGFISEHPEIARFIRRLAINLLIASEEYSDLFKISTPAERYHYIEKNNPQLLQRISLSQMASYLGIARETLSRIRSKNH